MIDCDSSMDVDGGWLLSGVHLTPSPQATIIIASLPLDGDYTSYMEAGMCVPFNNEPFSDVHWPILATLSTLSVYCIL